MSADVQVRYSPVGFDEEPWVAVCWLCFGTGWLWQHRANDYPEWPDDEEGFSKPGRMCCSRCEGTGVDPDQPSFKPRP